MKGWVFLMTVLAAGAAFAGDQEAFGAVRDSLNETLAVDPLQMTGRRPSLFYFFVAGGSTVTFAFIIRLVPELLSAHSRGTAFDVLPMLKEFILFLILISAYGSVASFLIAGAASLGSLDAQRVSTSGSSVLQSRFDNFARFELSSLGQAKQSVLEAPGRAQVDATLGDGSTFSALGGLSESMTSAMANIATAGGAFVVEAIFSQLTLLSYVFASAIIFFLRILQLVMFTVLASVGPFMIGLAALPYGPFRGLIWGWVTLILEVGLWGFVGNIFLDHMSSAWASGLSLSGNAQATSGLTDLAFNFIYTASFLFIPVAASAVVRGGAAVGVGAAAIGAITTVGSSVGQRTARTIGSAVASRGAVSAGSVAPNPLSVVAGSPDAQAPRAKNWAAIRNINKNRDPGS